LASVDGTANVHLTTENLPPHSHGYNKFREVGTNWKSGGEPSPGDATGTNGSATTESTGSGEGFSVLPPFFGLYYIMKIA